MRFVPSRDGLGQIGLKSALLFGKADFFWRFFLRRFSWVRGKFSPRCNERKQDVVSEIATNEEGEFFAFFVQKQCVDIVRRG